MSALPKVVALVIGLDGLLGTAFGHEYMEWLERRLPESMRRIPKYFRSWPETPFRLATLAQGLVGFGWLAWQLMPHEDADLLEVELAGD